MSSSWHEVESSLSAVSNGIELIQVLPRTYNLNNNVIAMVDS